MNKARPGGDEGGIRNGEGGKENLECGIRNGECGLRPLRAVGSRYEPEAIGACAYAPAGMRKRESGMGKKDEGRGRQGKIEDQKVRR
jgi:hypothetical protein